MKDKIDVSNLIGAASVFITMSAVITAVVQVSGFADDWILTEYEFEKALKQHAAMPHDVARVEMTDIRREMRCQYIDVQITIIEDQIYRLEHDEPTAQRLVDLRRQLRNLEDARRANNCAQLD